MIKKILSNVFGTILIIAILLGVTIYTDSAKKTLFDLLHIKSEKVLGIKVLGDTIDPEKKQQEVQQAVKGAVDQQIELAKQQVLNIKVGDILDTFQQSKKIVRDIGVAGAFVQAQIREVQKKLPHNAPTTSHK